MLQVDQLKSCVHLKRLIDFELIQGVLKHSIKIFPSQPVCSSFSIASSVVLCLFETPAFDQGHSGGRTALTA